MEIGAQSSPSDRLRSVRLREALLQLYQGTTKLTELHQKFPKVDRRSVTRLHGQLPKGLVDNVNKKELSRAVSGLVGLPFRGLYTEWELQQAVGKYAACTMTAEACTNTYGVGASTLRKKRLELEPAMGKKPNLTKAMAAVKALALETPGP